MPESGLVGFWKAFWHEWELRVAMRRAAAVAFFSIFSIAPLAALSVRAAEVLVGHGRMASEVVRGAESLAGPQAAQAVRTMVAHMHQAQGDRFTTVFGLFMLFFGASLVFTELKMALNAFWEIEAETDHHVLRLILNRVAGAGMVIGTAILLNGFVLLDVVMRSLGTHHYGLAYQVGYHATLFALVTLGAALTYKWLPDAKAPWRAVWPGAITAGVLFGVVRLAIGTYVSASRLGTAYGQAGALAMLLVWIYLSVLSYFVGAQVIKVYARRHGLAITPDSPVPDSVTIERARAKVKARFSRR